jgi:hypothetical protein
MVVPVLVYSASVQLRRNTPLDAYFRKYVVEYCTCRPHYHKMPVFSSHLVFCLKLQYSLSLASDFRFSRELPRSFLIIFAVREVS